MICTKFAKFYNSNFTNSYSIKVAIIINRESQYFFKILWPIFYFPFTLPPSNNKSKISLTKIRGHIQATQPSLKTSSVKQVKFIRNANPTKLKDLELNILNQTKNTTREIQRDLKNLFHTIAIYVWKLILKTLSNVMGVKCCMSILHC